MDLATDPALTQPAAPIVELAGLTKRFPGVLAVDDVTLQLRRGEVHALLGENGAGKSTIVGMLSGLQEPDEGCVRIAGQRARLNAPRRALDHGISTVFQHVMLVPTLTVFENLVLGMPWWRRPNRGLLEDQLAAIRSDFGIEVDLDALVGDLSLGEQQQIEIARALIRQSKALILDEATSMLTPQGAQELGELMRRLVQHGLAIVFITHKLEEATRFGDRISILRLGRLVGEIGPERLAALDSERAMAEVVRLMFGAPDEKATARPGRLVEIGPPLLEVRDFSVAGATRLAQVQAIDLTLHGGEILGIAGIDGNGQKQLAEALSGQRPLTAGHIYLDGKDITSHGVAQRREAGLRYLTDDRLSEGTVGSFAIATNAVLKEIGAAPFWTAGIERKRKVAAHARRLIDRYEVKTPHERTPIGKLSGGNVQKLLLARELQGGARVVVFNKPTYGLDLQNIKNFRRRILDVADSGAGVLLISTDLEELLELCDRIAVMSAGRIVGTVDNGEDARHQIGTMMIGPLA